MTSHSVIKARDLVPISTISNTVIDGRTVNMFLYKTTESNVEPESHTLALSDFLAGLASESSVLSSSRRAATAVTTLFHTMELKDFISSERSVLFSSIESARLIQSSRSAATAVRMTGKETLTAVHRSSVRKVGPELKPITPTSIPTTTTAILTPSNPYVRINVSNTLDPDGNTNASPAVIVGVVLGTVIGMTIVVVLLMLLFRRSHRHSPPPPHHDATPLQTLVPHRTVAGSAEWPRLPDPEYFAPKQGLFEELPRRPRLSGETFTEEDRVGHAV